MKLATARIDGTATVVAKVPGRNTVVLLDSVYDAAGLGNPRTRSKNCCSAARARSTRSNTPSPQWDRSSGSRPRTWCSFRRSRTLAKYLALR